MSEVKGRLLEQAEMQTDALDDIRDSNENCYTELNEINERFNDAVDEFKKLRKVVFVATFIMSFLVSFGIGLMIFGKKLKKILPF